MQYLQWSDKKLIYNDEWDTQLSNMHPIASATVIPNKDFLDDIIVNYTRK